MSEQLFWNQKICVGCDRKQMDNEAYRALHVPRVLQGSRKEKTRRQRLLKSIRSQACIDDCPSADLPPRAWAGVSSGADIDAIPVRSLRSSLSSSSALSICAEGAHGWMAGLYFQLLCLSRRRHEDDFNGWCQPRGEALLIRTLHRNALQIPSSTLHPSPPPASWLIDVLHCRVCFKAITVKAAIVSLESL